MPYALRTRKGPRIEADPAQETATFAQLLRAALGPKTMHANRAAMREMWDSQVDAELWVIGKTIEALFNTVAAVTVTE